MPGGNGEISGEALEDVAFLARSPNRVRLLVALEEAPATRRELEDATGIARATVGRIVADFEERGWVTRTADREYATTPTGERVATEFAPFVRTMEAIRRLGDMVAWIPTDEVPIGLEHFGDATVVRRERADPMAPATFVTGLLEDAAEFQCLVGVAPPLEFERAMRDGVVAGELATRHVITSEELEYLQDFPERIARWRRYVEAGGNVYCYDGRVPCNLLVFDDVVVIGNSPSEVGDPAALLRSEDETVRSWADEVIDRYQRVSERLDPEAFVERDGAPDG